MMGFLAKHRRILILGGILAVIFGLITALSTEQGGTEIRLTEFITRERVEEQPVSTFSPTPPLPPAESTPTETVPSDFPPIEIRFLAGVGWTPGSKNGVPGQRVIWRNETSADIFLIELFPKTSAIANGVTIPPGQTAEIILSGSGLFTYRELNSQSTGRIFILE